MSSHASGARRTVLLIHGGLAEDMDADRFWVRPGIVPALRAHGMQVIAPDRDTTPSTWSEAAREMAMFVREPVTVVGASNGVSVALRLALDHRELVARLVLLWPATAGRGDVDAAVPAAARHLLAGDTIRGTRDAELRSLRVPTAVMGAEPATPFHQHHTVERIVALIPGAKRIAGDFPEAPRPEFAPVLDDFVTTLMKQLQ